MARKNRTRITLSDKEKSHPLKRELAGFFCLLIGVFFYLCLLSFDPLDPSFFTTSHHDVNNLGGIIGSYLAGFFIFLFGGASYFIGFYFIINSILLFMGKRSELKWLDFMVFLICSVFIAIFLQIQFHKFDFSGHSINAGGSFGTILGDLGSAYLGKWGIYLLVIFGAIVTFIFATRLSLLETLNASTVIVTKSVGGFRGRFFFLLLKKIFCLIPKIFHVCKILFLKFKTWREKKKEVQVIAQPTPLTTPVPTAKSTVNIDRVLQEPRPIEPKIKKRTEEKMPSLKYKQLDLESFTAGYELPSLDFLDFKESKVKVDEASLKMSAKILEKKLMDFGIDGKITEIHPGPVITMYEFQPAPGVKVSRIQGISDDLSMAMGGRPVRIVAPLPNKPAVGIEIPNHDREIVWLKEIISNEKFQNHESKMLLALGKDIEGFPAIADLRKMPHLLVAGATGAGKSVAINSMICSILYKSRPDEIRMIMIDPKMIELSIYEGIPHLLLPVVTDANKANLALKWAVREMERRYQLLADVNARNLNTYNRKIETGEIKTGKPSETATENGVMDDNNKVIIHEGKLPYIVVIVDEFADLMMVSSKEVEFSVCRLAQKARAAGIHVILATQRPSVDVITGVIKANFPSRIAFKVTSRHDSRTILDNIGAEQLLGMGDMLFVPPGTSDQTRLHGAFISEDEIIQIVNFLKEQAQPIYNEEILKPIPEINSLGLSAEDFDELYDEAVREVIESNRVSISSIQRKFRIGYNRAARIVELMEQQGIVTPPNAQGQREVMVEQ